MQLAFNAEGTKGCWQTIGSFDTGSSQQPSFAPPQGTQLPASQRAHPPVHEGWLLITQQGCPTEPQAPLPHEPAAHKSIAQKTPLRRHCPSTQQPPLLHVPPAQQGALAAPQEPQVPGSALPTHAVPDATQRLGSELGSAQQA